MVSSIKHSRAAYIHKLALDFLAERSDTVPIVCPPPPPALSFNPPLNPPPP